MGSHRAATLLIPFYFIAALSQLYYPTPFRASGNTSLILPITLVLDNARYQHCHMIIELAAQLGIELLFLPPSSPNLNLIERPWKFVKYALTLTP